MMLFGDFFIDEILIVSLLACELICEFFFLYFLTIQSNLLYIRFVEILTECHLYLFPLKIISTTLLKFCGLEAGVWSFLYLFFYFKFQINM